MHLLDRSFQSAGCSLACLCQIRAGHATLEQLKRPFLDIPHEQWLPLLEQPDSLGQSWTGALRHGQSL